MQAMVRFQRECAAFFRLIAPEGGGPLVFGDGLAQNPVLMLVGEAPGEQEALQGKPFVGRAGKNLDGFLETLALKRNQIYVTNVVKFRPTRTTPSGGTANRPPTKEERLLFAPWLMREIAIVRPAGLVTLGNVALQAFLKETVGERHGAWTRTAVSPPDMPAFTLPLFPLYHPASIIYNPSLAQPYQEDLLALKASLEARSCPGSDN